MDQQWATTRANVLNVLPRLPGAENLLAVLAIGGEMRDAHRDTGRLGIIAIGQDDGRRAGRAAT